MAETVIDLLELVDIRGNDGQLMAGAGLGQFAVHQPFKMAPVQGASEIIGRQVIIDDVLVDEEDTQGCHRPGHRDAIKKNLEQRTDDGKGIVAQQ